MTGKQDEVVSFSHSCVLSDVARKDFIIEGKFYASVDHFLWLHMLRSFGLFGVAKQLERIHSVGDFHHQLKSILRAIKNEGVLSDVLIKKWMIANAKRLLKIANRAKLDQNVDVKQQLIDTGDSILIFASKANRIVGIGLTERDFKSWLMTGNPIDRQTLLAHVALGAYSLSDRSIGPTPVGANFLGIVLMELRSEITSIPFALPSKQTALLTLHDDESLSPGVFCFPGPAPSAAVQQSSAEMSSCLLVVRSLTLSREHSEDYFVPASVLQSQSALIHCFAAQQDSAVQRDWPLVGNHVVQSAASDASGLNTTNKTSASMMPTSSTCLLASREVVDESASTLLFEETATHSSHNYSQQTPRTEGRPPAARSSVASLRAKSPLPLDLAGNVIPLPYAVAVPEHVQGELLTHFQAEIKDIAGRITDADCKFLNGEIVRLNGQIVQVITELPSLPPPHTKQVGAPLIARDPPLWALRPVRESKSKKRMLRKKERERYKAMFPTLIAEINHYRKKWVRGSRLTMTGKFEDCTNSSDSDLSTPINSDDDDLAEGSCELSSKFPGESDDRTGGGILLGAACNSNSTAGRKKVVQKVVDFAAYSKTLQSLAEFYSDDVICVYSNVKKNKVKPKPDAVVACASVEKQIKEEMLDSEWLAQYREATSARMTNASCCRFASEILFEDTSHYATWLGYDEQVDADPRLLQSAENACALPNSASMPLEEPVHSCSSQQATAQLDALSSLRQWFSSYRDSVLQKFYDEARQPVTCDDIWGHSSHVLPVKEEPYDADFEDYLRDMAENAAVQTLANVKPEPMDDFDEYAQAYAGYRPTNVSSAERCSAMAVEPELAEYAEAASAETESALSRSTGPFADRESPQQSCVPENISFEPINDGLVIADCGVSTNGGLSFCGKPVVYDMLLRDVRDKRF